MKIETEKLQRFIEVLKNTKQKECISISIEKGQNLSLTTSKFGCLPFIDKNSKIPENSSGKQLFLLAQINCEELPKNDLYPKKGILQFWILLDDIFGIDFKNLLSADNKRVIYISNFENGFSEKYQKYKELLLQIDSEFNEKTKKWDIIWGDCGVANFFISKENLEKLDFSEILYNWDCT